VTAGWLGGVCAARAHAAMHTARAARTIRGAQARPATAKAPDAIRFVA